MSEADESPVIDLDMLAQTIIDLETQVVEHGQTLDVLMQLLEGAPGGPWAWATLEPEKARSLWEELGEWVAWLERRYLTNLQSDLYELPSCWYLHPVGVEVLTALMVAHHGAYNVTKTTASFDLMEWHTRCLMPALEMLHSTQVYKSCLKERTHVRRPQRALRHDAEAFAAFVGAFDNGAAIQEGTTS